MGSSSRVGTQQNAAGLLEAQSHIWNHSLGYVNSICLRCALELGIPDAIHNHGGPMTLTELLAAITVQPSKAGCLSRIMRVLVHSEFFELQKKSSGDGEEEGAYALNDVSKLLVEDSPLSMKAFVMLSTDPEQFKRGEALSSWFGNTDPTAYEAVHRTSLWDRLASKPEYSLAFNSTMESDSRLVAATVLGRCESVFKGLASVVDVGGGTGIMAEAIAGAFPDMECTVLDLPHVVANLHGTKNLKFVGGDMFEQIPSANALMLKCILHDWDDENSLKILKKCREAIQSKEEGGKLIIIDIVVASPGGGDRKLRETQLLLDAGPIMFMGGKERNEEEWARLFLNAGFNSYKVSPLLGLRSIIEVYP